MKIDLLLANRFAGDLNMVFMYGNAVKIILECCDYRILNRKPAVFIYSSVLL